MQPYHYMITLILYLSLSKKLNYKFLKIFYKKIYSDYKKMSLHISSLDISSNDQIYDCTINLSETLSGAYNVDYQYIDNTNIPWIWNANYQLRVSQTDNGTNTWRKLISFQYPTIAFLDYATDGNTIATSLQNSINEQTNAVDIAPGVRRICTVTYRDENLRFDIDFDGPITLLWEDVDTSCGNIWQKTVNETGNSFQLPTTYMTVKPKFLEVDVAESSSYIITSRGTRPTMLWSTADQSLIDQQIEFLNSTNTFSVKIYRTNVPNDVVPIQNAWSIIISSL